jgi:uncharacterized protein (DUF302 family)
MLYLSLLLTALALSSQEHTSALQTVESNHTVGQTVDRLEAILEERNLQRFSRIDHAAGARAVGEEVPPMELLIFGNPAIGTQLMKCDATVGIDLPLKYLVFEDKVGKVWIGYDPPSHLAERHHLEACMAVLEKISGALAAMAEAAAAADT